MSTKITNYVPTSLPAVFDRNPKIMGEQLNGWLAQFITNLQGFLFLVTSHLNVDTQDSGSDIASASAITVGNFVHRITGGTTIDTINTQAATSASLLCLLIKDGVSLSAAGNIKKARTYAAGDAGLLCWYPIEGKWYPII